MMTTTPANASSTIRLEDIIEAERALTLARSAYALAVEEEIEQKWRLSLKEHATQAKEKGEEGALKGSNAESRKAELAGLFEGERAALRLAEKATRAARTTLDNAETQFTARRYQVRLLEC